ncbi:hypothetical protein CDAR_308761 [Caerostris darwini]|uniref:Uncharacterized protein n=1 Tax=Caerostris darwini TaxID=1538125 RepID=A0AAV4NY94_9ARAC|nr:hypothetical protein CDAR_308761 [Caerostris darwini]
MPPPGFKLGACGGIYRSLFVSVLICSSRELQPKVTKRAKPIVYIRSHLPENKDVPSCPLWISVPNPRNKLQQLENQSLNVWTQPQALNQAQPSTTPTQLRRS